MQRRRFLGLAGGALLAGCMSSDQEPGEPGETSTPDPTPTVTLQTPDNDGGDLSEEDVERVFRESLRSSGHDVRDAAHIDDTFAVQLVSSADSTEDLAGEIGAFAGAYATLVDWGHGGDSMAVFVYDQSETHLFTFQVASQWATAWNDGELDNEEYFSRVIDTIEIED